MTGHHVVVGAGPVGRELTKLLADRGEQVVVVTRSGRPVDAAGVSSVAADASDADRLTKLTQGAAVLYNCANPPDYRTWSTVWPPLASAILTTAERTGAVLATTGNLYPYGPVDVPMTEALPDAAVDAKGRLRAQMWADALAGHRAGRLRAFEVRGSDYVGTGVGGNGHVTRVIPAAMRGKNVRVLGRADLPHSWTDVLDAARTLVAAADRPDAWGRLWHVPTNPPRTQAEAVNDVLAAAGRPPVKVRAYPAPLIRAMTMAMPLMREVEELSYQRDRAYVLDSSAAQRELGVAPTDWDEVCRRTAA